MTMNSSWRPPAFPGKHNIVIIDNYDSYVYNIFQRIGELTDVEAKVFRNDQVSIDHVRILQPTHIVISPGPGNPEDPSYFGICRQVILELGRTTPVLGICLGHHGIGHAFGGRVIRATQAMHGKTSTVSHDGSALFNEVGNPFTAMRYHSLMLDPVTLPGCLRVTARTEDGIIMGVEHKEFPIHGVQFHPESIGTSMGVRMLRNFLGFKSKPDQSSPLRLRGVTL